MDDVQQRELTQGLQQGDSEAWRALYEAFATRIWQNVARLLGDRPDEVADVVQEVFIAAARSAPTYDPERGTIWQWLTGIARRQLALHFRRRQRDGQLQAGDGQMLSRDGTVVKWLNSRQPLPESELEAVELASCVRAVLCDLPEDYADLLLAKYIDEQNTEQIAADYGLSTAATSSRLARARRAFRGAFERVASNDERRTR